MMYFKGYVGERLRMSPPTSSPKMIEERWAYYVHHFVPKRTRMHRTLGPFDLLTWIPTRITRGNYSQGEGWRTWEAYQYANWGGKSRCDEFVFAFMKINIHVCVLSLYLPYFIPPGVWGGGEEADKNIFHVFCLFLVTVGIFRCWVSVQRPWGQQHRPLCRLTTVILWESCFRHDLFADQESNPCCPCCGQVFCHWAIGTPVYDDWWIWSKHLN